MVDFQTGLLHAAAELDPKRGRAAQELLALDIVREVQQTLKLQSREATSAVGAAMVDLQAGLLHAAVQLDPKQGHAAQEVLVLHIVLEVQQTLKLQIREATSAVGAALVDGVDALHHAAAEPDINIGRAVPEELVLQTAQAVQVNPNHAILTRAARAMVDRAQAMASAVRAIAM